MAATKRMKRALVSVFHKDGLDEILKKLHSEGVSFVSTGGTQSFIESLGLPCDAVEDLTSYPSILGGRVKTLHPKVFGGILARRENENDQKQLAEYEIPGGSTWLSLTYILSRRLSLPALRNKRLLRK